MTSGSYNHAVFTTRWPTDSEKLCPSIHKGTRQVRASSQSDVGKNCTVWPFHGHIIETMEIIDDVYYQSLIGICIGPSVFAKIDDLVSP